MAKYNVYGKVVGSKFLGTFEAATPDEAAQLALQANGYVSICHQCSSQIENAEIEDTTVEEDDGQTQA